MEMRNMEILKIQISENKINAWKRNEKDLSKEMVKREKKKGICIFVA